VAQRLGRVALIADGLLRDMLMSRRPGPELVRSNGHGRAANLADARPMPSNLVFSAASGKTPAEMKQALLTACRENGQQSCLIVRRMDNPVIASSNSDELSDSFADLANGAPNGDRLPLLVYRVNAQDGREELVRGAILSRLTGNARTKINISKSCCVAIGPNSPKLAIPILMARPDGLLWIAIPGNTSK